VKENYEEYDKLLSKIEIDEDEVYDAPSPNKTFKEELKFGICIFFIKAKNSLGLSSEEYKEVLDCNSADMSRLLHYKTSKFTLDRLFGYLQNLSEYLKENDITTIEDMHLGFVGVLGDATKKFHNVS